MPTSTLRQPRGLAKVNGEVIAGFKAWTWDGNSMFQADQFSVTYALGGLPANRGPDWWASQASLSVELLVGFPADPANASAADLDSLFSGVVDELDIDWDARVLRLSGRDLTAGFLDNKTSEKFAQKTSSEIATLLAGRRGLTPVVTATKTKVGRYYADGHVRLADDRTEWDLLTWLAREEGFVVYVQGKELHFGPAPTSATYKIRYAPGGQGVLPSGDMAHTRTSRVLTIAGDIKVIVRTWNAKKKRAITRTAQRSRKGGGHTQTYTYTLPGLDPEQAQQRANQILADLSRHEMRLRVDGPADNTLTKADLIDFSGTGTAFDQTYYPDNIGRRFDADGYAWSITAKNHSPESQPNL